MKVLPKGLPDSIITHLYEAAEAYGLEPDEDTIARLGACWLEKRDIFNTLIVESGMEDARFFGKNDQKGAIFLTYSGSLVSVGPLTDTGRRIEYTSIGFRSDVPPSVSRNDCSLSSDGKVDSFLRFKNGPLRQTSRIFRIAVCPENLSASDQSAFIAKTSSSIVESFAGMNRNAVKNTQ